MTRGFEVVRPDMRRTDGEVTLPTRGTSRAMAYDFYANANYTVKPNEIVKIWSDIKAYMGEDEVLLLDVRSSMGGKFMLANTIGVIDSTYYGNESNEGNIGFFLKNISNEVQTVHVGDRIGQGVFTKYLTVDNDIVLSDKRTGGFGSSGK